MRRNFEIAVEMLYSGFRSLIRPTSGCVLCLLCILGSKVGRLGSGIIVSRMTSFFLYVIVVVRNAR